MGWLKRVWGAFTSPTGKQAEKFVLGLTVDVLGAKLGVKHPAVGAVSGAVEAALSGDREAALQNVVVAVHEAAGIPG